MKEDKNIFYAHNSTSIKETDEKQFINRKDKQQINKNKEDIELLKQFGPGGGDINLTNYYTKDETDIKIEAIKKLTTGVKFGITLESWSKDKADEFYKATLSHNLDIEIQAFSIAFYVEQSSCTMDYRYVDRNNIEVYSDEPVDIAVVIKQALEYSPKIGGSCEIPQELIDAVKKNKEDILISKNDILENEALINDLINRPIFEPDSYYTKAETYNMQEIDAKLEEGADLTNYYNKQEIDTKFENVSSSSFEKDWGEVLINDFSTITETLAKNPNPRYGVAYATVGHCIYSICGRPANTNGTDGSTTVMCFDTKTKEWSEKANAPMTAYGCSASVNGTDIYVFGHYGGGSPNIGGKIAKYNTVSDTWSVIENSGKSIVWCGSGFANGKVYSVAGWSGALVGNISSFDIANGTAWVNELNISAQQMLGSTTVGTDIYFIGKDSPTKLIKYDTVANKVSDVTNSVQGNSGSRFNLCNDGTNIYIIDNNTIYIFNTKTNQLSKHSCVPMGGRPITACINGSLYINAVDDGSNAGTMYRFNLVSSLTEVSQAKATTANINQYAGVEGQLVVNTETNELHIMDGTTLGGHKVSGSGDVDLSNYYTKSQTDTALESKVQKETGKELIPSDKLELIDNHELDIKSNTANILSNDNDIADLNRRLDEVEPFVRDWGEVYSETGIYPSRPLDAYENWCIIEGKDGEVTSDDVYLYSVQGANKNIDISICNNTTSFVNSANQGFNTDSQKTNHEKVYRFNKSAFSWIALEKNTTPIESELFLCRPKSNNLVCTDSKIIFKKDDTKYNTGEVYLEGTNQRNGGLNWRVPNVNFTKLRLERFIAFGQGTSSSSGGEVYVKIDETIKFSASKNSNSNEINIDIPITPEETTGGVNIDFYMYGWYGSNQYCKFWIRDVRFMTVGTYDLNSCNVDSRYYISKHGNCKVNITLTNTAYNEALDNKCTKDTVLYPSDTSISVQHKRGTSRLVNNYRGSLGEIVVNIDDNTLHVMDGQTLGGTKVAGGNGGSGISPELVKQINTNKTNISALQVEVDLKAEDNHSHTEYETILNVNTKLESKADISNTYNKTEVYTKAETEAKISEASLNSGEVDLSAYATIESVDTKLESKSDKTHTHTEFATTQDLNTAIANVELMPGPKGDKGDTGLAGQDGAVGPKGDTGATGPKGDKGETGPKGDKGETGDIGPRGTEGQQGKAFEYSDFTQEQLASLKGEKGDKGEQGLKGDTGATGEQGLKGDKGDKGDKGEVGPAGSDANVDLSPYATTESVDAKLSSKANSSDVYNKAQTFTQEEVIAKIAEASLGGEVDLSAYYTKSQTDALVDVKADKTTTYTKAQVDTAINNIELTPGPKGDKGDKGEPGVAGQDGAQGPKGDAFTYADFTQEQLNSLKGEKGDTGAQGEVGPKGEKGEQGPAGADGSDAHVDLTPYATIESVDTKLQSKADSSHTHSIYVEQSDLDLKANASDVYNKTQTYTKSETEAKIAEAVLGGGDVDLSAYSTTEQMNTAIETATSTKVDKVEGKVLSSNDFTNELKTKLETVEPFTTDWGTYSGAEETKIIFPDSYKEKMGTDDYVYWASPLTTPASDFVGIITSEDTNHIYAKYLSSGTIDKDFSTFEESSGSIFSNSLAKNVETNRTDWASRLSAKGYTVKMTSRKINPIISVTQTNAVAENLDNYAGVKSQIIIDTTNNTARVMDGATLGGHVLAKQSNVYTKTETYTKAEVDTAIAEIPAVDTTALATKTELTDKITEAKAYADTVVTELLDSAPETLNTLNELATALGNDANFATTVTNKIATKADIDHTHEGLGGCDAPFVKDWGEIIFNAKVSDKVSTIVSPDGWYNNGLFCESIVGDELFFKGGESTPIYKYNFKTKSLSESGITLTTKYDNVIVDDKYIYHFVAENNSNEAILQSFIIKLRADNSIIQTVDLRPYNLLTYAGMVNGIKIDSYIYAYTARKGIGFKINTSTYEITRIATNIKVQEGRGGCKYDNTKIIFSGNSSYYIYDTITDTFEMHDLTTLVGRSKTFSITVVDSIVYICSDSIKTGGVFKLNVTNNTIEEFITHDEHPYNRIYSNKLDTIGLFSCTGSHTTGYVRQIMTNKEPISVIQANGDTENIAKYVGSQGQIVVNTSDNSLHLMDGSTKGGHKVAMKSSTYNKSEVDALIANIDIPTPEQKPIFKVGIPTENESNIFWIEEITE